MECHLDPASTTVARMVAGRLDCVWHPSELADPAYSCVRVIDGTDRQLAMTMWLVGQERDPNITAHQIVKAVRLNDVPVLGHQGLKRLRQELEQVASGTYDPDLRRCACGCGRELRPYRTGPGVYTRRDVRMYATQECSERGNRR